MNSGYVRHRVVITGESLLMHNGQTADPLNKYSKAMKAITNDRLRKKTDEGIEALTRIEYEAGLYLDSKKRVILPSRILEAHLCEAARKTKEGKVALAGLFVDTDAVLDYEGGPMSVAQLIDSEDHRLTVAVGINGARIMRVRPLFRNWQATFEVSLNDEMVSTHSLQTWLHKGGSQVGLCDYRPRYGRYELVDLKVLNSKK